MTQNDQKRLEHVDSALARMNNDPGNLPPGLMERVLADASTLQPKRPAKTQLSSGFLSRLADAFGGLPALGAIAAASCVGFWIGLNPPAGMMDAGMLLLDPIEAQYDDPAEVSGFGWDVQEG